MPAERIVPLILCLLQLTLGAGQFRSGELLVERRITSRTISSAELLEIELALTAPAGTELGLPDPQKLSRRLTLTESSLSGPEAVSPTLEKRLWKISFEPDLPGDYQALPLIISAGAESVAIPGFTLKVQTVLDQTTTEFSDIAPDLTPPSQWPMFIALFIAVGFVLADSQRRPTALSDHHPTAPAPTFSDLKTPGRDNLISAEKRLTQHLLSQNSDASDLNSFAGHSDELDSIIAEINRLRYSAAQPAPDDYAKLIGMLEKECGVSS